MPFDLGGRRGYCCAFCSSTTTAVLAELSRYCYLCIYQLTNSTNNPHRHIIGEVPKTAYKICSRASSNMYRLNTKPKPRYLLESA